jgi:TonB family protein
MTRNAAFWRNAVVIAIIHVVVLAGLARWSGSAKPPPLSNVVWMQPADVSAPQVALVEERQEQPEQVPAQEATPPPMEDPLTMRTPPPTEIEEPTPTPKPRATPRPTPRPTAKPTPKKAIAKASPKPAAKKVVAKKESDHPKAAEPGSDEPTGAGSQGAAASEFNWYGNMLHDRFHGGWVQPMSASSAGAKMSTLVRLRIEKDGRVSSFDIVRSSGNVVVDESVRAVAQKVTRVDPPPATLAPSGHYDVRINFELDVE